MEVDGLPLLPAPLFDLVYEGIAVLDEGATAPWFNELGPLIIPLSTVVFEILVFVPLDVFDAVLFEPPEVARSRVPTGNILANTDGDMTVLGNCNAD